MSYLSLSRILVSAEDTQQLKQMADSEGKISHYALQKYSWDAEYFDQVKKHSAELEMDIRKLNLAFQVFDKDGDGFLTKKEFSRSMKNLNDYQVNSIFSKYDHDNDEKLSIAEFKNIMNAKKRRAISSKKLPIIKITSARSDSDVHKV